MTYLARELRVTPEHLWRVYRSAVGATPQQVIGEEKIRRACFLLEETDCTCSGIAQRLGYSTPGNFARAFRRATGMSPLQFREGPPAADDRPPENVGV